MSLNGIWVKPTDDPATVVSRATAGNIKLLFLWIGAWNPDGSINFWWLDSAITNWRNTVKSLNANLKILPFVLSNWQYKLDISTASKRQTAINTAVNYIMDKGFDGFHDDTESYTGTIPDLVAYWNDLSTALRNVGKISSNTLPGQWAYPTEQVAPYLDVDYVVTMLYNGGAFAESDFKGAMHRVLTLSASPVIVGMRIDGYSTIPLSSQLTWIDEKIALSGPYNKLGGFSMWSYEFMRSADWDVWNAWSTKNQLPQRYFFDHWEINGVKYTSNPFTFTVGGNVDIKAVYSLTAPSVPSLLASALVLALVVYLFTRR